MIRGTLVVIYLMALVLTGCGYGREEDKQLKRKEDLEELSQEMNNSLMAVSTLKVQLRDSLAAYSAQDDSLNRVKVDKYRLLISELEQVEEAYKNWQEEIEFNPSSMPHEEAMEYYNQEEEKAEILRQDLRKTVEYVESEIRK